MSRLSCGVAMGVQPAIQAIGVVNLTPRRLVWAMAGGS